MEKTITIFSEIGDSWWGGSSKEDIWRDLDAAGVTVLNVVISSQGGDAFEALAMYDFLKGFKGVVNTYATGIVASAATFPLLAGDKVFMTQQSALMMHNASTYAYGDSEKLIKVAGVTAKVDTIINSIYAKKSGQAQETIKKWMNEETWFTAEEALAAGLIDEIRPLPKGIKVKVTNSLNGELVLPARIKATLNPNIMFEELTDFLKKHFIVKPESVDNAQMVMDELTVIVNKTPDILNVEKINGSIDALAAKITNMAELLDEAKLLAETNKLTIVNLSEKIAVLESQEVAMSEAIANISTGVPSSTDRGGMPVADNFVKNQLNLK